jgi:DNA-binding MarR family transcriptional regulator
MEKRRTPETTGEQVDLGIVDALVQLSFAVQSLLGRIADGYELSLIQVRLLGVLRDREPSMMELAAFLELDKSSVSGLVDRAERRDLVRRTATPSDRRAVHVVLTDRGRKLARAFGKDVEREVSSLVEGLPGAERKRLSALASRIAIDEARRRSPGASRGETR